MEEIVPYTRQEQPDYLDNILPGYRFCPTDSELILYYLKPKIETGEHPQCRIYAINLYDHNPEQLTNGYRACDDKWYFFTPRERKYQKGKVPNRRTGDFGFWKTTQRYTSVYHHDATGPRVVGTKRSLAYHDETSCKTSWLMQEYTMNDPNLPIGSGQDGNKVLTDWVLCKIYKKKGNETENTIVEAPHQVFASEEVELPLTNSTGEYLQNHSIPIPTNSFQSPLGASASTSINIAQQSRSYPSPVSDHILQQYQPVTNSFQFSNGASSYEQLHAAQQPAFASQVTSIDVPLEDVSQQNQSTSIINPHVYVTQQLHTYLSPVSCHILQQYPPISTATNSFQLSNGASSSISPEPHVHAAQPPTYTSLVTSTDLPLASKDISQRNRSMLIPTNSFQFSEGASNSTSNESLANAAQPPTYTSPMTSEDVHMDDFDDIFIQLDDFEFDDQYHPQWYSFEDLMSTQFDP